MRGSSSQSTSSDTAGVRRSSGCWASRAATTATSSASACSTAFGRRTWAAASTPGATPGGSPESGWGAVG
eukprot:6084517-Alexandrium_andersonii.AAC.1